METQFKNNPIKKKLLAWTPKKNNWLIFFFLKKQPFLGKTGKLIKAARLWKEAGGNVISHFLSIIKSNGRILVFLIEE